LVRPSSLILAYRVSAVVTIRPIAMAIIAISPEAIMVIILIATPPNFFDE
jgi:hypothetical protein